jgi:hypothetical protein
MIELNPTTNRFLGALAGEEVFLPGNAKQQTYARKYTPCDSSDDLRRRIGKVNLHEVRDPQFTTEGVAWKAMGEEYSRTQNGYFRTIKQYDHSDQREFLSCYAYALGTFGARLEELVGKKMEEIQASVQENNIDSIVKRYFKNVTEPRDGDLVVYSIAPGKAYRDYRGNYHSGTMHAGIYRVIEATEKSPQCECIESKWGVWRNPYVFQHEVFFMSPADGEEVKIFSLNE